MFQSRNIMVVGLGNLDRINSRHSVGMKVIDRLAIYLNMEWAPNRHLKALTATKALTVQSGSQPLNFRCHLLKSKLPMNANGASVRRAAELFSVEHSKIFLIHDELDKSVGKFGVKANGSARGHNGVRSVFDCLSTDKITRLFIGIDRPTSKNDVVNYVLSNFSAEEQSRVDERTDAALVALLNVVEERLNLSRFELINLTKIGNTHASDLPQPGLQPTRRNIAEAAMSSKKDQSSSSKDRITESSFATDETEIIKSRSNDPSPER